MIIPVRCFTCNRVLASKYDKYLDIISNDSLKEHSIKAESILTGSSSIDEHIEKNIQQQAFEQIGVSDRYCCKRHLISHIDLIQKI